MHSETIKFDATEFILYIIKRKLECPGCVPISFLTPKKPTNQHQSLGQGCMSFQKI